MDGQDWIAFTVAITLLLASIPNLLRRGQGRVPTSYVLILALATCQLLMPQFESMAAGLIATYLYTRTVLLVTKRRTVMRHESRRAVRRQISLPIGLIVWLQLIGLWNGDRRMAQVAATLIAIGLLYLACRDAARHGVSYPLITGLLGAWLSSIVIVGIARGNAFTSCDSVTGKCSFAGALLTAGLPSENALGLIAAILLLSALALERGAGRSAIVGTALLLVLLSGSRSMLVGVPLSLAAGAGLFLLNTRRPRATLILASALTAGITAVAIVVIYRATPGAYSSRGTTWSLARQLMNDSLVFGKGEIGWINAQLMGELPQHYPHSQYLLALYFGGVIALVLLNLMIVRLLVSSLRRSRGVYRTAVYTAPTLLFLIGGVTEVIWDPTGANYGLFVLLTLIFVVSPSSASSSRSEIDRRLPAPVSQPRGVHIRPMTGKSP